MSYLTGTPTECADQAEAIGTALGYPVAPRVFKDGVEVTGQLQHDRTAQVLASQQGRIRYEPEIVVSDDGTEAALEVEARAEEHLGKTVKARGKDVAIKARGQAREKEALPAKVAEVLARRAERKEERQEEREEAREEAKEERQAERKAERQEARAEERAANKRN